MHNNEQGAQVSDATRDDNDIKAGNKKLLIIFTGRHK